MRISQALRTFQVSLRLCLVPLTAPKKQNETTNGHFHPPFLDEVCFFFPQNHLFRLIASFPSFFFFVKCFFFFFVRTFKNQTKPTNQTPTTIQPTPLMLLSESSLVFFLITYHIKASCFRIHIFSYSIRRLPQN